MSVLRDSRGYIRAWILTTGALLGIAALITATIVVTITLSEHYDHSYCGQYAQQWHRPTRFVRYGFWSWDCLTKVNHQWLPTDQVRVVVQAGR